jgi:PcRGLX-like protein central beta sandwich domain/Carbohydrate family 9 binding domain-like
MISRIALLALLCAFCLSVIAAEVSLSVTNRSKAERWELAAGGVPMPMGAEKDTAAWRVFDSSGKAIPAQFTVLNRWPADKSIRWALVQFPAKLAGGATGKYTLKTGAGGAQPKPAYSVKIKEEKDRFVIDTGVLRFAVKRENFALFDTIETLSDGKATRLAGPAACGPAFTVETAKGKKFNMAAFAGSKVSLEDVGPLRATVKAEGRHLDARGGDLFGYQVRIYAVAGSRAVRVQYVFTCDRRKWPKEHIELRRVGVTLKPGLKGALTRFALEPSGRREPAGVNQVLSLNTDPISADAGGKRRYAGPAVAGVSDATGKGLSATVRWFWQSRPKSIEVAQDGSLTVNLIDTRKEKEPIHFYPGMAKTHDILFQFKGPGASLDGDSSPAGFQQSFFVKCQPSWYCQKTLSLGRLVSSDYRGYFPKVKKFAKLVDSSFTRQIEIIRELRSKMADPKRGLDSYHVVHFGDGFHHLKHSGHRGVEWDNCYYSYCHLLAMQYARTGEDLILDTLREAATFEGDIAVVWHPANLGAPRVNPGAYHIAAFSGWGKRFNSGTWNFYKPIGMLELYYLTGDRRHQEAGVTNARWMLSHNGYGMLNNPRSCGAGLRAAVHGYLATGDTGFMHLARKTGLYAIGMQKAFGHFAPVPNSIFMAPNALEGLCVYHEFSGDKQLGKILPDMVRKHAAKFSRPGSPTYAYMNLYVAALTGDVAYREEVYDALAARGKGLGVRRRNHAIKDFSATNRGVPLMMWYLTDLAKKPTPWAGKTDLGAYPAHEVACPRMAPPKLDGKVSAGEWDKALELKLVYDPDPSRKLTAPGTLRIAHDLKNLYLLVKAEEPAMDKLKLTVTEEGGPVYRDDCVEIYVSPVPKRFGLKFIVNARGIRATRARGFDKKKYKAPAPADLPVKAGKWKKGWLLEVTIPLSKLGLKSAPAAGTRLGFNVLRFRCPKPYESSTWIGAVNQVSATGTITLK